MEQIQAITHSQPVGHLTPLRVPAYLRLVLMLLVGFAVANIGARTLARSATASSNPFLAYADIFPGQPTSAIQARGFSCPSDLDYNDATVGTFCRTTPTDGVFSQIYVIISNGIIRNVNFIMRDKTLMVGDLEIVLGVPLIHKYPQTPFFIWISKNITVKATIVYAGRFSLFLPIWGVSFREQ